MLLRFVLLAVACGLLFITGCVGQSTTTENALNGNSPSGPTVASGPTGPDDPLQRVAPGPVDENVPTEFQTTASGLRYRILRASEKRKPIAANEVVVHYKGWLDNMRIFDSSYQTGETISFLLQ